MTRDAYDDIRYYVPTRGRLHTDIPTLGVLQCAGLLGRTVLVCPASEAHEWSCLLCESGMDYVQVVAEPPDVTDIGKCRAFMFEHCATRYFMMLDDDLHFAHQYETGDGRETDKIETNPLRAKHELYHRVLGLFETYPAVGIGSRMFCNERPFVVECKQLGWAFGFDRDVAGPVLRPIFGRLRLLEDVDWVLTMLEAGHKNVVASYLVIQGRRVSVDPKDGGCATYRNEEMVLEEVRKFAAFHPDTVKLRGPRDGLNAATQYRQRISWSKALGAGRRS